MFTCNSLDEVGSLSAWENYKKLTNQLKQVISNFNTNQIKRIQVKINSIYVET